MPTETTTSTTEITPDPLMQLAFGFMGSKVLFAALELDLFTRLAKSGSRNCTELARELNLHDRSARDFLDTLVALKLLERDGAGRYTNSPLAAQYLDRAQASCIAGILDMCNARLYKFWDHLTEALRTGQPQNEAKGGGPDPFAAIYGEPARLRQFLSAMTGLSAASARGIAAQFPWGDYKTFADVGTAQGAVPAHLALAHPHLNGVGFDLAAVRPVFEEYVRERGVADRVRFVAGDFFKDTLPSVDVIIMGHILHDWDLKTKRQLVAKAYDALPPRGALIVYDAMIDDERRTNVSGLFMSLNMLIETPGGFDYTPADCHGWLRDAGFRDMTTHRLAGVDSMVVAYR
ncbi:MAG TPA: methyltransferase [Tepidisphaeraceae bacterium]|jgi:hypothetical protein